MYNTEDFNLNQQDDWYGLDELSNEQIEELLADGDISPDDRGRIMLDDGRIFDAILGVWL